MNQHTLITGLLVVITPPLPFGLLPPNRGLGASGLALPARLGRPARPPKLWRYFRED